MEHLPHAFLIMILTKLLTGIGKMSRKDKKVVLNNLVKRIAMVNSRGEEWVPLHMYRNSLVLGEGGGATVAIPDYTQVKRQYIKKSNIKKSVDENEDEYLDEPNYRICIM